MTNKDYRVSNYDYDTKKYSAHVRGHLIDHQDSILGVQNISTYDPRNYIPEPPEYEWGLGIRRLKVAELRKQPGGGAYAQMNVYPITPLITMDGTPVPEDVRFYAYSKDAKDHYIAQSLYHVEFEEDMSHPKGTRVLEYADENFLSSLDAAPIVTTYSPALSDRTFRYQGRDSAKKEQRISDRTTVTRFPSKDAPLAACAAAESEFESAGRQLHAGIVYQKDNPEIRVGYVKRACMFGQTLAALDSNNCVTIFSKSEIKEGRNFFGNIEEDIEDLEDLEDLEDQFRKLCADETESKNSFASNRRR